MRDRQRSEDANNLSEVNKITADIKKYQEKWRSHVHRMPDTHTSGKAGFRKTTNEMV
jgi:hypothetical protein